MITLVKGLLILIFNLESAIPAQSGTMYMQKYIRVGMLKLLVVTR